MKERTTPSAVPFERFLGVAGRNQAATFHTAPRDLPARLLAYLRDRFDDARIDYASPPARMLGGLDTQIYRFRLRRAPPGLEPPLVLRLYGWNRAPERTIKESAVQNALARQGYPVPPVPVTCSDRSFLRGAFLIMPFEPGRPMLSSALETMPERLGRAHAELHDIDPAPVVEELRARGLEPSRYRYGSALAVLRENAVARDRYASVVEWLLENRPPEPARLSVCHGDFQPMNLLLRDGKTAAVLDWSDFIVADPALDVASTMLLIGLAGRHVLSLPDLDWKIARYLAAYCEARSLDTDRLDYYRVRRGVLVLMDAEKGSKWRQSRIVRDVVADIRRITRVAIPDG